MTLVIWVHLITLFSFPPSDKLAFLEGGLASVKGSLVKMTQQKEPGPELKSKC